MKETRYFHKGEESFKRWYERRLRHLETPEFWIWFEEWFGKEDDYMGSDELRDEYLSERRFALIGFLAGRREDSHLMTKLEFGTQCLPMKKEKGAV